MAEGWLIIAAAGIGAYEIRSLLGRFGDVPGILRADSTQLAAAGLLPNAIQALQHPSMDLVRSAERWLLDSSHSLISAQDARYPPQLLQSAYAPAALFIAGNIALLQSCQLAVVGARHPTDAGAATAFAFAAELARQRVILACGLRAGIESAVQRGVDSTGGSRVIVLGLGDEGAPHASLHWPEQRGSDDAAVSAWPPGKPLVREDFLQRQALLAGLSLGTLVVEAGIRSTALLAARFAVEAGREVFAIPGSIHNPLAKGCHQLLRSGAKLVERASDIIQELPSAAAPLKTLAPLQPQTDRQRDPQYADLLRHLADEALSTEAIASFSGLTQAEVSSMLLILELEGEVRSVGGGCYQRNDKGLPS